MTAQISVLHDGHMYWGEDWPASMLDIKREHVQMVQVSELNRQWDKFTATVRDLLLAGF